MLARRRSVDTIAEMPRDPGQLVLIRLSCFALGWLTLILVHLGRRGDPRASSKMIIAIGLMMAAVGVVGLIQRAARHRIDWFFEALALPVVALGICYATIAVRSALSGVF